MDGWVHARMASGCTDGIVDGGGWGVDRLVGACIVHCAFACGVQKLILTY